MIVIYTSPGCASCRKVKSWLKTHDLEFIEKNIFTTLLSRKEIQHILTKTENGFEDIISKRSKIIQENKVDFDSMSTNELVDFIIENPSVLRRPLIISEKIFQVGYDSEEIDAFIPRELKELAKADCGFKDCSQYKYCGALRAEVEMNNDE